MRRRDYGYSLIDFRMLNRLNRLERLRLEWESKRQEICGFFGFLADLYWRNVRVPDYKEFRI